MEKEAFTDVATGNPGEFRIFNRYESVEEAKERNYRLARGKEKWERQRKTSNCVTGYFPDSVTGASRSRLFNVKSVVMCRFRKIELPLRAAGGRQL